MRVFWIVCILTLAATASVARTGPAKAQTPLQRSCEATESPVAIRACTSIISNRRTKAEDKADALLNRGDAYRLSGRKREALADYKAAHKIAEELFDRDLLRLAAMSAAETAFDLKEYVQATFMYIDAYDEDESNTETKYNLRFLAGVSAARAGQTEVAIGFFDEAVAILPNEARGYRERGIAYGERKEHDKALTDLNKAIELDPKNSNSHVIRGLIHKQLGNGTQARADILRAIDLDPNNKDALGALQSLGAAR